MAKIIPVWDRPSEKAKNAKASFALTETQVQARETIGKQIAALIEENLDSLGGFVTPGNDESKGTVMVALSLPMPAIHFRTEGAPADEETRTYTLNVNATIPAPKKAEDTSEPGEPVKALTYADLQARRVKAASKK
jgi:hypothetical protein